MFASEEGWILLTKRDWHWAKVDGEAVAGQLERYFAGFHENWDIGLRCAINGRVE